MDPELENFDQLRRLLALKRHEQPPPRYWENFSSKVVARIEAGERGAPDSLGEWLLGESSLLRRFWSALEAKPVLAGAFGVAMCGLLITGVLRSEDSRPPRVITPVIAGASLSPGTGASEIAASVPLVDPLASSTNPAPAMSIGALFDRAQYQFNPQTVGFSKLANGN